MAFPTAVNDQITDSVTQTNLQAVGTSPSVSLGTLYQGKAHALSLALLNATAQQQQTAITAQASTTAAVAMLLGVDAAGKAGDLLAATQASPAAGSRKGRGKSK